MHTPKGRNSDLLERPYRPQSGRGRDRPGPLTADAPRSGHEDASRGGEASERGFAHVAALDGLRGIAVVAVIAFHADLSWAVGGFLGVDMFFVLSGFLITSLLRVEHARRGTVSLPRFWSRRARRLLPALGFLCLAILVFAALRPAHQSLTDLRWDMISSLAYVANWRFVMEGGSYFAGVAPSPLRHLWSLAIEEQFYVVWPLVFLLVVRFKRPAVFVAAAAVVSALLMAVTVDSANPSTSYYGTLTHAHGLLLGAALAFMTIRPSRRLSVTGVTAALAMATCFLWFGGADLWVYRGGLFAFELSTAVVIAACLQPHSTMLTRMLSCTPLRAIGLVSYGLYLWHWPVFVLVDGQLVGFIGYPLLAVQLVITVAVTVVSYFVIELPFRRGTLPGRYPAAFVPIVAGALVTVLLLVSASLDSPIANAARLVERQQSLPSANPAKLRVLLVGDSSTATLAPGIEEAARSRAIEIVSGAEYGCALDWSAQSYRDLDGTWSPMSTHPACEWPRSWPKLLRRYRPDLVLINFGVWDATDHGAAADLTSLWWALAGAGLALIILALSLRNRLEVFDPLDQRGPIAPTGHHWALAHFSGADMFHHAFAQLHDHHSGRPSEHADEDAASQEKDDQHR